MASGGYTVKGGEHLIAASDKINDAVNMWGHCNSEVYDAWLEWEALGEYGEPGRIEYEGIREEARQSLYQAQNVLMDIRDTLRNVANGYKATEDENEQEANNIPRHRKDI